MSQKRITKIKKKVYREIGWYCMRLFLFPITILPLKCLYIIGEMTATIAFFFLRRRRNIALENLRLSLGEEKSEREILAIYRSTIRNIGKGAMELLSYPRLDDSYFDDLISVEGRENLDEAVKRGKGVVAVSAHFGNFAFLAIKLARMGYPFSVILRNPRQEGLARYLEGLRNKAGMGSIPDKPPRVCVEQSLRWLKKNGILFLQIDLNVISGGVYVEFFGRIVPTFKGPVVLAMRTGAAILPVFILGENGNRHKVIIEPPLELELTGDKERDIFINLTRLSKIVESYIRKYPDEWWWIHQRWRKARPIEI
ncbi:MAG: lysophospholipid acyltransferase family protein [Pseudomonadota bacterium]